MTSFPDKNRNTSKATPDAITVVISTRNRGSSIVRTIQSVLLNDYPYSEIIVVDQSEDNRTKTALLPFIRDAQVRYIASETKGISVSRNIGIINAHSELVAITDDDCEVSQGWLREISAAFKVNNRIGVVFGNVIPGVSDTAARCTTSYVRREPFLAISIEHKHHVEGISGSMAIRKSVWQSLGGFDQTLGLGMPLKSAEECDFTIRALLADYLIYESPAARVTHNGFCQWESVPAIIRRNWYGSGAVFAKHFKLHRRATMQLLVHLAVRWTFGQSRVANSFGDRPHRLLMLKSFIRGFIVGTFMPVNRTTGHFCETNSVLQKPSQIY
ncbi:MAG: glycosyltransferase family 2 protein [Nitrospinales bacterium]